MTDDLDLDFEPSDDDLGRRLRAAAPAVGPASLTLRALGPRLARAVAQSAKTEWWVTLSYLPYALPPVLLAVLIQPTIIRLRLSAVSAQFCWDRLSIGSGPGSSRHTRRTIANDIANARCWRWVGH